MWCWDGGAYRWSDLSLDLSEVIFPLFQLPTAAPIPTALFQRK